MSKTLVNCDYKRTAVVTKDYLKKEIFARWQIEIQSGDCNFLRLDYSAQQTVFFATVIAKFLVSLSKTGQHALVVT